MDAMALNFMFTDADICEKSQTDIWWLLMMASPSDICVHVTKHQHVSTVIISISTTPQCCLHLHPPCKSLTHRCSQKELRDKKENQFIQMFTFLKVPQMPHIYKRMENVHDKAILLTLSVPEFISRDVTSYLAKYLLGRINTAVLNRDWHNEVWIMLRQKKSGQAQRGAEHT